MLIRNSLAKTLSLCGVLLTASLGQAQDKTQYYTYKHAGTFEIDWVGFYDKIDEWTAATREKLPHKLDIAYGDDEKQKLDLYWPREKPSPAPVFLFIHGGGLFPIL